jgi:hypothetical protein
MNLDYFLKYFVPKDTAFFPLFEEDVKILIKACELFKTLMATEDIEQRDPIIKHIKGMELEGDEITHQIYSQLNKSFITPFDREDIQELAATLDDVLDYINGASQRINLYKPKVLIPVFVEFSEIIFQAAKEIEYSVNGLRNAGKNKDKIIQSCIVLNTLENKADDFYHMGISKLFEEEKDTIELIKNKEILNTLEKAVDKAEDVSDVIKTILVKLA